MVCYKCGQNGHFKRECPNGKRRRIHRVDAESKTSASLNNFTNTTDYYGLLDVSGSMQGNRLEQAKNTFRNVVAKMGEHDRISIVTFDSNAYFKLKPRPVGQIRRQNELEPLLKRIYAQGATAIWDAIYMTVSQIRDKNRHTVIVVLTDGKDNSSSHTYQEVLDLLSLYSNIELNIVHVADTPCEQYENICRTRGQYQMINETEIEVVFTARFNVRTGQVTVQQPVVKVVDMKSTTPVQVQRTRVRSLPLLYADETRRIEGKEKRSKLLDPNSALYNLCEVIRLRIVDQYGDAVAPKRIDYHTELIARREDPSADLLVERCQELHGRLVPLTSFGRLGGAFVLFTPEVTGYGKTHITIAFFKRDKVRRHPVDYTALTDIARRCVEEETEPIQPSPSSPIDIPKPVKLKSTFYNCHLCNRKYKTAKNCLRHFNKDHGLPENHPVPVKV